MAFMSAPASGGGDFTPVMKYNAAQGRLYLVTRTQNGAGDWETSETEVTQQQPAFAVDFGGLEVGWTHFVRGMAPQWNMVPYGNPLPVRPASPGKDDLGKDLNFKNGFRVKVAGNAIGGVRELAGNSAALINGMNELHTTFESSPEAAMGVIPVVKLVNTIAVKAGQSTNFQPVFVIQSWVDRPDVLGARTVPAPRATAAPVQATPAQPAPVQAAVHHTPPPVQHAAAALAADAMPF